MNLKIRPISNLSNFFRKSFFWKIFSFNITLQLVGRIENEEYPMGTMRLKDFYELYELIENLDVLLGGKPWNTLTTNELFSTTFKNFNDTKKAENEEEKENGITAYDENECVICLDKKIETILACMVCRKIKNL